MRTSFDFKILVPDLEMATENTRSYISRFTGIDPKEVFDMVDVEFKVSLPKAETAAEIAESMDLGEFVVHVFGTLKRTMAKPFGA
jgi:hypothetical protein